MIGALGFKSCGELFSGGASGTLTLKERELSGCDQLFSLVDGDLGKIDLLVSVHVGGDLCSFCEGELVGHFFGKLARRGVCFFCHYGSV